MPKGPTGQRRPGDVIGTAINVAAGLLTVYWMFADFERLQSSHNN